MILDALSPMNQILGHTLGCDYLLSFPLDGQGILFGGCGWGGGGGSDRCRRERGRGGRCEGSKGPLLALGLFHCPAREKLNVRSHIDYSTDFERLR